MDPFREACALETTEVQPEITSSCPVADPHETQRNHTNLAGIV